MNSKWLPLAAIALLAIGLSASSQEPDKSAPVPLDIKVRAAEDLANISAYFGVLDVSESLVAANGLGIDVAVPEAALRAQLGLEEGKGLVVTAVPDESCGKKAGLQVHDIVLQVYGHDTGDLKTLGEMLDAVNGQPVKIKVLRAGKTIELEATPQKPELARVRLKSVLSLASQDIEELVAQETYRIGVTLAEADDTLRAHLRLAAGEGLIVTDVIAESAAAAAGILQHDVLVVLDGKRLTTVEAVNAQVQEIKDKSVELRLLRGGKEVTQSIAARKTQEAAFVDRPITFWDTKSCQRCHANPIDTAHAGAAWRLHADKSVWTDGSTVRLWGHLLDTARTQPAAATAPQEQINVLKEQLAEMQKTLSSLEAALAPAEPQPEKKEE